MDIRWPSPSLRLCAVAALVVFGLLAGCTGDGAATAPEHPWLRSPSDPEKDRVQIAAWMVYRVAPDRLAEAVKELEHVSYVQVSPGMASHLTGQEVRVPAAARPFLVRGLDGGGSEMTVWQSASALWVRATAGEGHAPTEQPLLVLLDPTPVGVFVTVGE